MNNVITIKTSPAHARARASELIIHPEKAAAIDLGYKKFAYISFGSQKHYVNIRMANEISPENVLLSRKLTAELHLPNYPVYEICVRQNEILIGPYIGLLLSDEDRKLTASRLKKMMVYLREYPRLHGCIVVFALNKADPVNRLVEGYCYNPVRDSWQRGIFPYPTAIYRTIGLREEWKNHFLSVIGDKIFNNRYFNKWEMYQWFSNDPDIKPHLPDTQFYHSPQDAFDMLEKFPRIYIKPVSGLRGRGIVRISMEDKMYLIKYRENKENCQITCEDLNKVSAYLHKRFHHGRYLVQQAIDLLEYEGRIIDFRCVLQKNQANAWVCQALIGRSGVRDSIVSNISSGGRAFPAAKMLEKVISITEADKLDLMQKIVTFTIAVCNRFNELGINCGTLGLDIGIDTRGRLWLIEINNRDPDPSIALDIHDEQLYHTLKTGPLYYAKLLAGFKDMDLK